MFRASSFNMHVKRSLGVFVSLLLLVENALAGEPYAVVLPVEGHSKLQVKKEGLDFLRSVKDPIAPVVVIGPYRSGKSFLLNQLLNVSCNDGFGVGHTRNTQTKGVWVWNTPQSIQTKSGMHVSVLFVDTEGFESTGKSDSYDDRIFALSAIISSVLIYNLPETVRESDIEKLSFAVELASGLYNAEGGAKDRLPVEPGNMLWLIQRDFLEGKSVQEMVNDALKPVANPYSDNDIDKVNRIRQSLSLIAKNSTAFGLKQPHLERTKLCGLNDSDFDSGYVKQRGELRGVVKSLVGPKMVTGRVMTGKDLADLIDRVVTALNEREIPTVGSILDNFNLELVHKCVRQYTSMFTAMEFPVEGAELKKLHLQYMGEAVDYYETHRFGSSPNMVASANRLKAELKSTIEKEYDALSMNNTIKSGDVCENLELKCENKLADLQKMGLPSKNRFEAEYTQCKRSFDKLCVGPARVRQQQRLETAWVREKARFVKEYNDRLYMGLVILSLVDIVVFRFLTQVRLLEGCGWVLFLFLEAYPKTIASSESMYSTAWWKVIVQIWEFLAYNPVTGSWMSLLCIAGAIAALWYLAKRRKGKRRPRKFKEHVERDLDV